MQAMLQPGIQPLARADQRAVQGGNPLGIAVAAATLGVAMAGAMGAGFQWGYNNLGPTFNRYF